MSLHIKQSQILALESNGICATSLSACQSKDTHHSSHRTVETFESTSFYGVTVTQTTDKLPKASFCLFVAGGGKEVRRTYLIKESEVAELEQNISNFAL